MVGIAAGESDARIASVLGRARSTVGREIRRSCRRRCEYRALRAERRADRVARRPKERKLERCPRLLEAVGQGLVAGWSPEQITARLRVDHPDDMEMRISPETIYQSLFVQARGELRRQLKGDLRSGRTGRRQRSAGERRGRMVDMISISERPAEVEDRAVPGHWEGDLLMGANNQSAIATLVERHTRYVLLARLEDGHGTERVIDAIIERIGTLPAHLAKSLTWDQGRAGRAQALHGADRHSGVLLRSALAVAARVEREHQRAAAPIPTQGQRSGHSQPDRARPHRKPAQRTPPQDVGLDDPGGESGRAARDPPGPPPNAGATIATPPRPTGSAPRRRSLHPPTLPLPHSRPAVALTA